ncbi:choice-of-anchor C family protein [Dongia sedimenti]|uniref:Choice-of-anchor C family protein n=1 Tax=Dongia sedimenti TaxID=3064282 RepID=A0ABU0YR40_9PROT|nr:choice-of-anchor C family protein [Rhodospirillaceae bacterium R-7]
MANDSTHAGQVSSEQDTTPINDGYFADAQGEDAFFGPEQLAQAQKVVPVPPDQNVVRVQVNPGEIIELSSPFDPGVTMLGREADGNLAIRVGDVTVILVGFVEANAAAPVVVETSDGQPIDIATLLASTDPTIDIQTAAGPGDAGQGGQGADNTGAFFGQVGLGNGLGGLNSVGAQDQTQLSYSQIDNAIRLDREDALLATTATPFRGLSEPFLRDPVHQGAFMSFDKFIQKYDQYVTNHPGQAWADFEGTQATGDDFESYLSQTSFTSEVAHSSTESEHFRIDKSALEAFLHDPDHPITSDGSALKVVMRDDDTTAFVLRKSDNALVLVFHLHAVDDPDATSGTGNFQIDSYLIDRLDHPAAGNDILSLEIPYQIFIPVDPESQEETPENPNPQETIVGSGSASVDVLDDIPVVGQTDYYSFLHAGSYKDALACFDVLTHGNISDYLLTHNAGQVDEDYIFGGNRDKDNAAGPDEDDARGDTIGDRFVVGQLHVNFGADGASGQIPNGDHFWEPDGDPIFTDANPQALTIAGYAVGSTVPGLTSQGHALVVLKHETVGTIEILQVGYHPDAVPAFARGSESCDTVVFTLLLQTGPNLPLIPFGGFVFEQSEPLDHPVAGTLESNLQLLFPIIVTDDDGDHPVDSLNIVINVNDDAPTFQITYTNEDPQNCDVRDDVRTLDVSGGNVDHYTTKDYGHVDEDWLNGGVSNDGTILANGPGNHDTDGFGDDNANTLGDDKGGLEVCGQIKVKFGADGPSDAAGNGELGLKTYDIPLSGPEPAFVNGDGQTLTSDGKPLVVLESDAGHLLVGVAASVVPGEGPEGSDLIILAQKVFELNLNPDTGKFEFQLWAAIDHVPSTVDGNPESNLVLSFDVGFAQDYDLDQVLGAINIKVNDDKPEVGITYYNEAPKDVGDNAVLIEKHKDTDFGRIDEDWLKDGAAVKDGSFEDPHVAGTFIALPGGSDQLNGWVIGGAGVDHIGSYWQASEGGQSLDMSNLDAGSISRELTGLTAGREYTVTFDMAGNPDGGPTVKSLKIEVGGASADYDFDTTGHSKADMGWQTKSFTFVATSDTETLTFTSLTPGAYGPALDNVSIVFNHPGNQDLDANGNSNANQFGDDYGSSHLSGQINMKYGADGPGTQSIGLATVTEAKDADGNQLYSGGHELTVLTTTASKLEVGYDGVVVFTLALDSNGHFDFTQSLPIDHPIKSPIEDNVYLTFKAGSISDGDGDTAEAVIKIQVNDDTPEVGIAYYNETPGEVVATVVGPSDTVGKVDEDWLKNGNQDEDENNLPNPGQNGDDEGGTHLSGQITLNYGGDGPGSTTLGFVGDLGTNHIFPVKAKDDNGNDVELKTADGDSVLGIIQNVNGKSILTGVVNEAPYLDVVFRLELNTAAGPEQGKFTFELKQPLQHSIGGTEDNLLLSFNAGSITDADGDTKAITIKINVNDDAPLAMNDSQDFLEPDPDTGDIHGNVLENDKKGADVYIAFVSNINGPNNLPNGVEIDNGGGQTLAGMNGFLTIYSNGDYHYTPNMGGDLPGPGNDTFTYTLKDADGDTSTATLTFNYTGEVVVSERVAFAPAGPTHEPAPHYDHEVTVSGLLGLNGIVSSKDTSTYHFEDPTGGHVISGGAGNDFINVTGNKGSLLLSGNGGDDIIHAGNGGAILKGGNGDDTLFGGTNADSFYGDAGHDAMSGGDGNDTFHVDADDLDGTNTLDGFHTIDGGDGIDTADISGLKTFDSSQAVRLENVEHLALEGNAAGGGGTTVTLSYDAAYGITEVGGLHQLSITGDKADTVYLQSSGGNTWSEIGNTHVYESGGASKVTVTVDHDVAVQLS